MDDSSSTAMVGGDNNNNELLLPLKEWVYLSSLAEEEQQESSLLPSPENIRKAQVDYVTRAVVVAAAVLDKLLTFEENNYDDWCPRDISVDNIHLEMGAGDVNILRRREMTIDLTTLKNIQGVELSIPQNNSRNGGLSSDGVFKKVGFILYCIFSRGEVPPSSSERTENNNTGEEATARGRMGPHRDESIDDSSQHEESDSYEEKAGPNKGRQKVSIHEATKTFRGMNISNVEDALSQKGLSAAICRMIADLIVAPEDVETHFQSLSDAVAEMQQIMRVPQLCFGRDTTDSNNSSTTDLLSLRFGDGIVGRSNEVGELLQASARAQMDTESSHICLIGGMAGVGKSYLVDSVKDALQSNGWIYLSCKFDRLMRNQPLVTIASSMESFIQQLIHGRGLPDGFDADAVIASIEQSLSASGIVVLSDLVPSLRVLYRRIFAHVIMDDSDDELNYDASEASHDDDDDDAVSEDGISSANTLRNRLHYLFGRLIEAISSVDHPIFLFLDDLQWADTSSLELLLSLLISWDHDDDTTQRFLIVGAFRSNEVDEMHILPRYIQQFENSTTVSVTNIQLDGITKYGIHVLVSEALLLPLRLTRGLADVVYSKSLGNPLFAKSLLRQLVDDNILRYSLSKKRWVWDVNDVKSVSVDDNVAELMKHKLLRLPSEIQDALKLISCFGIQVSNDIISKLCASSESRGEAMITYLEQAREEHILDHNDQVYKFAHDILQQAAYDLMSPEEKGACHFNIGLSLMSSVSTETDELMFTVADQINNAKRLGVTDVSMGISFAKLNLQVCKRSMDVSDFVSAWQYVVFGISFLPEEKWGPSTYELALGLHEAGALACFVNVDTNNLQLSLKEIFDNAVRFEDKIKAYYILAQNLASLNRLKEAIATVRFVLNELGEYDIPEEISPDDVQTAMMSTHQLLDGYSKEDIVGVPRLKDEKKQWAVKLMEFSLSSAFMVSPRLLPILANRIIKILVKDGACRESAFGLSSYSLCLITIRRDIEAGYTCSKMAIALMESFDAPGSLHRIKTTLQNFVTYLVEPIQSTANVLLESYEGLLATGDNEYACLALSMYLYQSIQLGSSLPAIEIECEEFALRSLRLHQLQYCRNMSCTHNMILALTGNQECKNPFNLLQNHQISTEDDLLQESLSMGRSGLSLHIYFSRLFAAFWLKKYTEAAEFAAQYRKLGRSFSVRFIDIYHALYEGLTAFHLARCSTDETIKSEWMGVGEKSVDRFKVLHEHSTWNYENKLLLLQAECHRCKGEGDDADSKYLAAIESAQQHRFLHEEGLAMELYASFLAERGESDRSSTHLLLATACYEKWGASAVVNLPKSPE